MFSTFLRTDSVTRFFRAQMYKEAEEAYEKVLEIDTINDPELEEELFKSRALQLQVNWLITLRKLMFLDECFERAGDGVFQDTIGECDSNKRHCTGSTRVHAKVHRHGKM